MRTSTIIGFIALALTLGACAGTEADPTAGALPVTDATEFERLLADSESPMVVNLWASWCIPCRSEAPLLRDAEARFGDDVRFIGVAVRDEQDGARAFIGEFGLAGFEHYFDRSGAVPAALGARGVPLTFFFKPGGERSHLHTGVLDEGTLAVWLDEIRRGGG